MLSLLETLWPETFWPETFWPDTIFLSYVDIQFIISMFISMYKFGCIHVFILKRLTFSVLLLKSFNDDKLVMGFSLIYC